MKIKHLVYGFARLGSKTEMRVQHLLNYSFVSITHSRKPRIFEMVRQKSILKENKLQYRILHQVVAFSIATARRT